MPETESQLMKAIVTGPHSTATITVIPVPDPGPHEIRVKVHSIALNPVDALYTANPVGNLGRVIGSDIAGVVDKIGEGVSNWKLGGRVAGLLQGATSGTPRPGGFAQYAILEDDLAIRIPDGVSFDEAATFPLCSLTAAQALFIRLEINPPFPGPFTFPPPKVDPPTLLVYSASTSLGLFTVELAKSLRTPSGKPFEVIATASLKNHAKICALGADAVYDYRSQTWPEEVLQHFGGVDYAVDCISEGQSTATTSRAFREGGGKIAVIRKVGWDKEGIRSDVTPLYGAAWSGLGHDILYNDETLPASPTWRALTVEFYKYLSQGSNKDDTRFPLTPNPVRLMPGGLEKVPVDGLALLGPGKVTERDKSGDYKEEHMKPISGEKLVYRV